jgi:glutaredoxin
MKSVKVYTQANCAGCEAVKKQLMLKAVEFEVVRIDQDEEARQFILRNGFRSVPQVFVDGVPTDPNTITNEIL